MRTQVRHAVDDDATAQVELESTRRAVARAADRQAKSDEAARRATIVAVNRQRSKLAAAEAIATLGISEEELAECIELGSEFCWVAPLTRTAAIEHLAAGLNLHQLQQQEIEQQVHPERQHQEEEHQRDFPQPMSSESQLAEPEPLQLHQHEHCEPQHFSIGTVAEDSNFDIASEDSEEADSNASPVEADPDDAFWWSELHASDAQGHQHTGDQQPHAPSDEGGRPAKRHRPG